jgi:hypothetical protein
VTGRTASPLTVEAPRRRARGLGLGHLGREARRTIHATEGNRHSILVDDSHRASRFGSGRPTIWDELVRLEGIEPPAFRSGAERSVR